MHPSHPKSIDSYKWGLIPEWSKKEHASYNLINSRAETIAEKPSFKHAFYNNRCLIPSSGFYEWKKTPDGKIPYYFKLKERKVFAFAGIYSAWQSPEGKAIKSCSILTTTPNDLIKDFHNRMPVILTKENEDNWINPEIKDKQTLLQMLKPYDANKMESIKVSNYVNDPKNNSIECIVAK
ncbi:MAG: SOS response-associated peptidase [Candidatus Anammoxibacter sp.]